MSRRMTLSSALRWCDRYILKTSSRSNFAYKKSRIFEVIRTKFDVKRGEFCLFAVIYLLPVPVTMGYKGVALRCKRLLRAGGSNAGRTIE